MMYGSILTDNIMRAHFGFVRCEGFQGLITAVLSRMVYDYKIGFAKVKVGRAYPIFIIAYRISDGILCKQIGQVSGSFFIFLIGDSIWASRAGDKKDACEA
jgi:hypothetical protein